MDARDACRIREGEEMSDIEPVAWAIFRDGELDWEHDLPFSDEPQSMMDDEESRPLYDGEVIEQLRADAERYRWIRDRDVIDWDSLVYCCLPTGYEHPDNAINSSAMLLDAAIDAAMKEERK